MNKLLPALLELLSKLQDATQQMTQDQIEKLQAFTLAAQMHLLCLIAKINAVAVESLNNVIVSLQNLSSLILELGLNTSQFFTPDIPEEWKLTYVLSKAAESHPAISFAFSWLGPEFPAFVISIVGIRLFFRR